MRETIHFDSAINPYGCSPQAVMAMEEFARSGKHRFYGDATAATLRSQIAAHFALAPENVVVFNGAGEALAWVYLLNLVMRRGRLIFPSPSYERFAEAGKSYAAEACEVKLEPETFELSIEKMINSAGVNKMNLGLISNPNNPTGNFLLDNSNVKTLLSETPECLWIIDEAYADYSNTSFIPLVKEFSNLVVLRTFSKAYGLAGMRVGYAVTNEMIAAQLAKIRLPWSVNQMSLVAAEAAFADQNYLREIVGKIKIDCQDLRAVLEEIPFLRVYESAANFFLLEIKGKDTERLKTFLAQRRMRVRSRADMPQFIRVTSMLPAENLLLIEALRDFA